MIKPKKGADTGIHRLGREEMIKVTDWQGMSDFKLSSTSLELLLWNHL